MGKYTLDTDFSSLDGQMAEDWMKDFQEMVEAAFADSDNRHRLLGNLLVIERCVQTLRQGLEAGGEGEVSPALEMSLDFLWDYLKGRAAPDKFQEFANCLYACLLFNNVGEDLTGQQEEFYGTYIGESLQTVYEWLMIEWSSCLLMELTAIEGGKLEYDEFQSCRQIDFGGFDELLNFLEDACIELTRTPLPSNRASDVMKAMKQVYQTPLFRQIISDIQNDLKTAVSADSSQFSALREDCSRTILPEEYAAELLEY